MELSKRAEKVIERLEKASFEAYAVGGCIRDKLLKAEPSDYDIATSALPDEIKAVFFKEKTVETGIKHGTVTVIFDDEPFEITTFRLDSEYCDGRHPEKVEFTKSIEQDLARRDFTINAIAYNNYNGLVDPFSGKKDIEAGLIRAVGEAEQRFNEDALRIMRALRFSSVLGFEIEEKTKRALFEKRELLLKVSVERISAELLKLLCGRNVRKVLLEYIEVLGIILPELLPMRNFNQQNPYHIYDVLEHTAAVVENVPPKPFLRLAALLHDVGKPDCFTTDGNGTGHFYGHAELSAEKAEIILRRLKFASEIRKEVTGLIKYHMVKIEPTPKAIKHALNKFTPELFFELIELKRGDALGCNPAYPFNEDYYETLKNIAKEIIEQKQCFSLKDLAVNGDDLIAAGFCSGKKLGKTLDTLLRAVLDEKLPNEKLALLDFIKKR